VEAIKIDGLAQFRRKLKALDAGLPKMLRLVFNKAMTIVVDDAQPRIPRRTGRAAAALRGQSTANYARVTAGGAKAPHLPWLDFGGKRAGRGGGVATRQFLKKGRYVWFALDARRDDVTAMMSAELVALAEQSGLEVT
jgi:hypothetical protein